MLADVAGTRAGSRRRSSLVAVVREFVTVISSGD